MQHQINSIKDMAIPKFKNSGLGAFLSTYCLTLLNRWGQRGKNRDGHEFF